MKISILQRNRNSLLSNLKYWQRDNRLTFDVLWFAITKTHAAHSDFRKITSISMNTLLRQLNHYDPFIKHEVRYLLSYDGLSRNLVIGLCVSTSFLSLFIHFDELNPPLLFVSFQGRLVKRLVAARKHSDFSVCGHLRAPVDPNCYLCSYAMYLCISIDISKHILFHL